MLRDQILQELRERFVGNPLLREKIAEVPGGYVSAFHFTHEECLGGIAARGLLPTVEVKKMAGREEEYKKSVVYKVDEVFDGAAPKGLGRVNFVYAHDDYYFTPHLGNGNLILEVKVDPRSAYVADAQYFVMAKICFEKRGETAGCEKKYWENVLPLDEYLKLPLEEKTARFRYPEILIPSRVAPDLIKIKGIFL
jgi:hypothetical protein